MTATETIEQFVASWRIAPENVTIVEETDAGNVVRYRLDLDSEAPREEVAAFYRMQSAEPLYTDGDRTWVYPDHVDDLPEADEE
jgi:hypothetical protein